jgi:CheY-like chemotaxis protein
VADRIRVLIVDDERVSALYLRKILDLQGYETKVVNDSRNALEELRLFKPNAVTVDGSMPGVSGCELAKLIRQEPGYDHIPIVSVSAYDESYTAASKDAGIDHHLPKPPDIDELCRVLAIQRLTPQERVSLQG